MGASGTAGPTGMLSARSPVSLDLSTSWDLIRGAAAGDADARRHFAERYEAVARAYLHERWRQDPLRHEVADAVQEVFIDCLRQGGVLQRADPGRGDFRGFLFGVTRMVALRFERSRARCRAHQVDAFEAMPADDTAASRQFDREWARSTMRLAMRSFASEADPADPTRAQRLELLRLRFFDGLPIRDIATRWSRDPAWVHHEFARARRDFKKALAQALGIADGAPPTHLAAEIARLWEALG